MRKSKVFPAFVLAALLVVSISLYSFIPAKKEINTIALDMVKRGADIDSDCTWNGKRLYGKIQFVNSFPDIKVQVVNSFPDLKVKKVESFPDDCGEWQVVESFPDLKVQIVNSFPDIKIKYVESFPGLP